MSRQRVHDRRFELRDRELLPGIELVPDLRVFLLVPFGAADRIDRPMAGGGHEPGAGIVRHA